ncbi:hypothetical protein [Lancefieldella parvula]|uniref:hypothetical protein n=1 Tax=Lancefieldella parvula TaxID=1382 RepID=UPI002910E67A|nr:hypothetical protein [Lancefieldella parvula]MDU4868660.1 hypothetical protein [Lancefieldella parvula]
MDIKKVDIKIIGSGYSLEKEETLKNQFKNLEYPVFVSGYPTCAAGVELFWTIVIFVSTSILRGQIYDWYKYIRDNIIQNIKRSMGKGAYQGDITLISTDCDITIRVNNGAGFRADSIDYQSLLEQISNFVIQEKSNGKIIKSVDTPCQIVSKNDSLSHECVGVGNYSLWSIEYKDNLTMTPLLYDAINQCFVNLENHSSYNLNTDKFLKISTSKEFKPSK